jgi:hypothetical protein
VLWLTLGKWVVVRTVLLLELLATWLLPPLNIMKPPPLAGPSETVRFPPTIVGAAGLDRACSTSLSPS